VAHLTREHACQARALPVRVAQAGLLRMGGAGTGAAAGEPRTSAPSRRITLPRDA